MTVLQTFHELFLTSPGRVGGRDHSGFEAYTRCHALHLVTVKDEREVASVLCRRHLIIMYI